MMPMDTAPLCNHQAREQRQLPKAKEDVGNQKESGVFSGITEIQSNNYLWTFYVEEIIVG